MSWDDFFCVCPYSDTYQLQLGLEFLVFPWFSVISFMSDFTFFILFLTMANSSSNLFWVNLRLFIISSTSSEIMLSRPFTASIFAFMLSFILFPWTSNSFLKTCLIVYTTSSSFLSFVDKGVAGVLCALCALRDLSDVFYVDLNVLRFKWFDMMLIEIGCSIFINKKAF